jgi:hypothetical protein
MSRQAAQILALSALVEDVVGVFRDVDLPVFTRHWHLLAKRNQRDLA